MKKLIALAFVGAFALALVACGGKKAEETEVKDSVTAPAPDTTMMAPDTTKTDTTAAH